LQRVFGLHPDRGRELVASLPRIVKRQVPGGEIARYEAALHAIGAEVEMRRSPIRPQQIMVVRGSVEAEREAARREQHGSTLTLPPPPPAQEHAASPRPRMGTIVGSARADLLGDTVVDVRPPMLDGDDMVVDPPPSAIASSLFATGPTLPETRAPHARPLPLERLAGQAPILDWKPPPGPAPASRILDPIPAPAPAPPPQRPVDARPAPPPAWSGIEPLGGLSARDQGDLPPASAVPGLSPDPRAGWVVDGADKFEIGREPAVAVEPEAAAASAPTPELGPVERPTRPRAAPSQSATALDYARAEERTELALPLRWLLRLGIGFALFLLLGSVRHCRRFDREVDKELATWAEPSARESAEASTLGSSAALDPRAPVASEWMESDLHQFSNGDKDRVRSLVNRFSRAGAVDVRVGHITRSGMVQIGSELIVLLPDDPEARKAVLAEYDKFLQSAFAGLAATHRDTGQKVLHVVL